MNENENELELMNSIFRDFFAFCHFDPDSEKDNNEHYSGNLLAVESDAWEISRRIVRLVKDYNSPYLAFIVLKGSISGWGRNINFTLDDIIKGRHSALLNIYQRVFFDERCLGIEDSFIKMISRFAAKPNLIGESDIKDVIKAVPKIVEEVEKLNFHPLLASKECLGEVEIRNKIRIYTDIGSCLMDIENSAEGLYLCYIAPEDTIDGYFSFIYKSNENIISIDDQIKEAYLGQHRVERRRNASYVERKAFGVFPYQYIFELSQPDAKGYYTEYKLKGEFSLNDLPVEETFALVVAMLLVLKKYCGKKFRKDEIVYSSYLIGGKAEKLIETKALAVKKDSALVLHAKTKVELTRNEIFADCDAAHADSKTFYKDCKPNVVDYLKRLWLDEDVLNGVPEKADYSHILNDTGNIEMISSYKTLKENALFVMRREMKDRLQKKIEDYFIAHDFGNEGIKKWRELVASHKDVIFSKIKGENFFESEDRKGVCIGWYRGGKIEDAMYGRKYFFPFNDINNNKIDWSTSRRRVYMNDDMGVCRYNWNFMPTDWKEACDFIGIDESELPKELKGWTAHRNEKYGNSILYMTDYMEDLQNGYMCFYDYYFGMCRKPDEYLTEQLEKLTGKRFPEDYAIYDTRNPFMFSVALSSRAFKKIFPGAKAQKINKE